MRLEHPIPSRVKSLMEEAIRPLITLNTLSSPEVGNDESRQLGQRNGQTSQED